MNRIKSIDSLRGLSILFVILFHLNLQYFKGGFLGVDIFFVISGFLITKILINYKKKKISFYFFLKKRLERIAPPFILSITLTFIFSLFIFNPNEIREIIIFSLFSSLFTSNLFFIITGNYFENVISFSPLLHTWSLSIEMQFYVFYAILFYSIYSEKQKKIFIFIILLLSLISFLLFNYFYYTNPTLSFFFTPLRIWEICLGVLTFFLNENKSLFKLKNNHISFISFITVIVLLTLLNKSVLNPYLILVINLLASSFILFYKTKITLVENVFFQHLGKISYSLYLLHFPIFLFFFYYFEKNFFNILFAICVSYILSILSYEIIELKFKQKYLKIKKINLLFFLSYISLFLFFIFLYFNIQLLSSKYPIHTQNYFNIDVNYENFRNSKYKFYNLKFDNNSKKTKILIIGDSFAGDLFNIIKTYDKKNNYQIKTIPISYPCQFLSYQIDSKLVSKKYHNRCQREVENFNNNSNVNSADFIFIAISWKNHTIKYLDQMLEIFINNKTKKNIVLVSKKYFEKKLNYFIENKINPSNSQYFQIDNSEDKDLNISVIDAILSKKKQYKVLKFTDYYCFLKKCRYFDDNNNLLSYDNFHLTTKGTEFFANEINFKYFIK